MLSPAFILSPEQNSYGFGNIFIASMNIEILIITFETACADEFTNEFMN